MITTNSRHPGHSSSSAQMVVAETILKEADLSNIVLRNRRCINCGEDVTTVEIDCDELFDKFK